MTLRQRLRSRSASSQSKADKPIDLMHGWSLQTIRFDLETNDTAWKAHCI